MRFNRSRPIPRCFRWCYKAPSARLSIRSVSLRHTEQVENVVRRGFSDVSMSSSLPIIKCCWYFISINGPSLHQGIGVKMGGGGREMRLLCKEGREALSILLSVRSVRCALKGLDWVQWVKDWERGEGGVITNNKWQCIWRFYRRYGR